VAEAVALLQTMKGGVLSALRQYEAALAVPDLLSSLPFAVAMNNLKVSSARLVAKTVGEAMMVCGIEGYRNDSPYSLGRHLRDAHSAALMVNDDRILSNTANLLPALREEPEFLL
jgi:acyl-CoA dehydrogenase